MTQNARAAMGVYVFAGLMTEGVKRIFDVPVVINPAYGSRTHANNHRSTWVISPDDPKPEVDHVDFMYSQPECAPWSTNSRKLGFSDPRFASTEDAFSTARHYEPDVFALESVVGAFTNGRAYYDTQAKWFLHNGYVTYHMLIDNQYHGTPQSRKRYFFVASKNPLWLPPLEEPIQFGDALAGVRPGGGDFCAPYAKRLLDEYGWDNLKPGKQLRKFFEDNVVDPKRKENGHVVGRPGFGGRRMNADVVAPAFVGVYPLIHPSEHRPLTMNEVKAWCGVPQSYEFSPAGCGGQALEMSRSVLPNTAEWIAKMALGTIDGKGIGGTLPEIIDLRKGELHA